MTSPRKEYWLAEHAADLGVPFSMGVGGSIDIVAGVTKRAPASMQRLGLEWFYRFVQEPRRLGPRYLRTNLRFAGLLARELVRAAAARGERGDGSPAAHRRAALSVRLGHGSPVVRSLAERRRRPRRRTPGGDRLALPDP